MGRAAAITRFRPFAVLAALLGLALVAGLAVAAQRSGDGWTAERGAASVRGAEDDAIRFATVRVVIDTETPLAAWQVTLEPIRDGTHTTDIPAVRIVGVEGGTTAPWDVPPHFDPAAVRGDRLIIGDFSLRPAADLAAGRVHVATVHLELRGEGDAAAAFTPLLDAAASADGRDVVATVVLDSGDA